VAQSTSRVYAKKISPVPAATATTARRQGNSYLETSFGRARLVRKMLKRSRYQKDAGMTLLVVAVMDKFMSFLVTNREGRGTLRQTMALCGMVGTL
jgi:hypothetical protein